MRKRSMKLKDNEKKRTSHSKTTINYPPLKKDFNNDTKIIQTTISLVFILSVFFLCSFMLVFKEKWNNMATFASCVCVFFSSQN